MPPSKHTAVVVIAGLVAIATTAVGLAASDSGGRPEKPVPNGLRGDDDPDRPPSYAAKLVNDDDVGTVVSSSKVWPVRNVWAVADGYSATVVVAGRDAEDRSMGVFAIRRTTFAPSDDPESRLSYVEVPRAGTLKITDAPTGSGAIQTRSQYRGKIAFGSATGVTGVLDLRDKSITPTG